MVGMSSRSTLHAQSTLIGQCHTSPYLDITTPFALMLQGCTISCEAHEIKELPVAVQLPLAAQETSHLL